MKTPKQEADYSIFDPCLHDQGYMPERLLDKLIAQFEVENDSDLARCLQVDPAVICRVRLRKVRVSGGLLIRMHDASNRSISSLRRLMGITARPPKT